MRHPVYLVRHGESEWNRRQLTQGQTRHPVLTAVGVSQSLLAARTITADLDPHLRDQVELVSSHLNRAAKTAQIIAETLDVSARWDPRWAEHDLGWLAGRSHSETWRYTATHDWSNPDLPIAGGESMNHVSARVRAAWADLDRNKVNIVISHGDTLRSLIAVLTERSGITNPVTQIDNGAVIQVTDAVRLLLEVPGGEVKA